MAAAEGIGQTELDGITGSGLEGRVTKHDMQGFIDSRGSAPAAPKPAAPAAPKPAAPAASRAPVITSGQDQIVEMDRMRKLIAAHMVTSVQTSPHVTSFVEADVTRIVQWRKKNKDEFMRRTGQKLTFTPFFIEAVARALRDFPGVNAQVDGDKIIMRGNINVGMAAATPQGNLIVPVIHNADQLNLVGLAEKVNELAGKARAGKLTADDMAGGTYTVSNVGTFGNVMGTPIINMPQVAILALGAIRKQPAVVEMPEGDVIAIRHRMFLSHSYDHRVVDGQLGGSFVRRVGDYLESFDLDRPIG
jgi:2-oxoglutarate dehydrogenase E2 component (dihydrolipoamide succinyltransferase)